MIADAVAEVAADRRAAPSAAFTALADRHLDSAYRLACVILGDPAEAEDATHDAAILAWRSFGSLRDDSRFEQWFCRIVTNVCRDRIRRRRRRPVVELPDDDASRPFPGGSALLAPDSTARLIDRDALDRAFARLDPNARVVLALRFYRDLPVDAIAERLAIPPGTVKSRLHNALDRLRRELIRQGWTEGGRDGGV